MSGDPVRSRRFAVGFVAGLAVIGCIAVVVHRSNARHSTSVPIDVLDEARATAVAAALLNRSPAPPEARSASDAPVARLAKPPQVPRDHGLIVRARFWTVAETASSAYGAVTADPPSDVVLTSNGDLPGSPAESFTSDAVNDPPFGIAYDHLILAAVALSPDSTAIAEYAEVAPRPTLTGSAAIPITVNEAVVSRVRVGRTTRRVLSSRVVTGQRAVALAEHFDLMTPSTGGDGDASCPAGPSVIRSVLFTTQSHRWQLEGLPCGGGITDRRDGRLVTTL